MLTAVIRKDPTRSRNAFTFHFWFPLRCRQPRGQRGRTLFPSVADFSGAVMENAFGLSFEGEAALLLRGLEKCIYHHYTTEVGDREKEGTAYFPIAIHGSDWGNQNSNFKTCLKRVVAYRMTAVNAMS